MGKLIYSAIASLDLYIADADGKWDWSMPDQEVHAFVNDLERPVGTHLYGRRMYEVMSVWDTLDDAAPEMRDFAGLWRAADKVVYSRTLRKVSTPRTRLERRFEPEAVRALKGASERDITIGGAGIASEAIRAGLVDEWLLFLSPIVVGGGIAALPHGLRLALELVDSRVFRNGTVFLRYRKRT